MPFFVKPLTSFPDDIKILSHIVPERKLKTVKEQKLYFKIFKHVPAAPPNRKAEILTPGKVLKYKNISSFLIENTCKIPSLSAIAT